VATPKNDKTTTDVATPEPAQGKEVATLRPAMAALVDSINGQIRPEERDPEEAVNAILTRIAEVDSLEEIFSVIGATHAQDVLGLPLQVRGVKWQPGRFPDGCPIFAVVDVIRSDTRLPDVITCGGWTVVAQLERMRKLDLFPAVMAFTKSERETLSGYYPMQLSPVRSGPGY
jgi:hypothetical protein